MSSKMQSGSKKVLQNLFKQKSCGTFCDVQLHLQGSILWGHACVLASCSPYFKAYLHNEADHWCVRKPLVITLDKVVDDITDICFICVSKIIDFMYLRELIVLKGHFQHFCKIVNFLKVIDLLPFCKNYFEDKISTDCLNSGAVSELTNKNITGVEDVNEFSFRNSNTKADILVNKSNQNENSRLFLDEENVKKPRNKGESTDSFCKEVNDLEMANQESKKNESSALVNKQNGKSKINNFSSEDHFKNIVIRDSEKKCEFSCCNPDLTSNMSPDCEKKQRKKRKMSCESCQFSSISINKMLKHVQTTNHFGKYCPVCNLKVENTELLNQHLKDHLNSKPFICHICQKRNRFWEYHKLHLRVHCRNKQFHCKICQRRFKYKQNLTVHLLTHNYEHVCNKCGYLSSDDNNYQKHQLLHSSEQSNLNSNTHQVIEEINVLNKQPKNNKQNKFERLRKFQCYVCCEKFTQQKNLSRHIQVKHSNAEEYRCPNCTYLTKRYDVLKDHMKRHHNCLPSDKMKTRKRKETSKIKQKQECPHKNGIVGVLIPVELISVEGNSTLNAYAVKAQSSEASENGENSQPSNHNKEETEQMYYASKDIEISQAQTTQSDCNNIHNPEKENVQDYINEPKMLTHVNISESANKCTSSEETQTLHTNVEKENGRNCKAEKIGPHLVENSENIWLNEATGEFLSGSSFISMPKIDAQYSMDQNNCLNFRTEKSSEDSFPSLIINEAAGNLSSFDLDDDNPQTNLFDFDNQDNLFPWESLGDNFCSTWVLNETTGELNMVSFGIQPLKNCDELKLDENTGTFSLVDDDETALFLNEGTGDLSVIYFNPNKNYSDTSNYFVNDQINQEKLETMSQHSNDEDDLLNEELFRASANFMAQDENETFLNELTGEFDVTHYNSFHSDAHQLLGNESIYLNEETGEISSNISTKNLNNDILSNADSFKFDFDDSLNCEDFEQFSTEISDFSSQFCLDNGNSGDWHNFDETCDTLLNECTGELVKRS